MTAQAEPREATRPAKAAPPATFRNEPLIDFSVDAHRRAMQQALADVRGRLGHSYPLVIAGERIEIPQLMPSVNPANKHEIVGRVSAATVAHVDQAVAAAQCAQRDWWMGGVEPRVRLVRALAQRMRDRLFELAAWQVFECGKQWREATNDVCEAIDFCEFYALEAIELHRERGLDVPGEENRFEYLPRGVAAIIAPWNFPLAILTGMAVAALVTGNTVLIKPAGQSPVNGWQLMELLQEVGFPAGVANFVPGQGGVAGARMVEHPDVALIAFTGSRAVGLQIHAKAAAVSAAGTPMIKHIIAELGGKNALIIDADADLDEAVVGTVRSAFGYQGQKCSACSRVIVLDAVYDAFVQRLVDATCSLVIAPAEDPASQVGPVIDAAAQKSIQQYIEIGKHEGRVLVAVDVGARAEEGFYVGPHVFGDVPPHARIAQEEIFGPVLAVIRARDLDQAIEIANGTAYALTGGMFSRSPKNLDRVRRELMVGNVYLNRAITGALVARQPFGGFKMSGFGTKAGGRDYLLQFVVPRTITENTMRRGFAPTGS
jgi:RHH-type proline utilization regulon transcriptional repressor/proline dehydrogenase/delta 1-pyrroline-5-carboxylate dehydrogenase